MEKIDFKKKLKHLYSPSSIQITVVDVPEMNFIMIDGQGDPNTSKDYKNAVEALFAVAYALKFMVKKSITAVDYSVLPLEGLWWVDDMTRFNLDDKDSWKWTAMIMQPEYVTRELFEDARNQVDKKKGLSALSELRLEAFNEGKAAQLMHIGPYAEEALTIEKIHNFIKEKGHELTGKHHEIYLGDPRRTAQEKLKTVIRQPFA